jgi:hypothetical protein
VSPIKLIGRNHHEIHFADDGQASIQHASAGIRTGSNAQNFAKVMLAKNLAAIRATSGFAFDLTLYSCQRFYPARSRRKVKRSK